MLPALAGFEDITVPIGQVSYHSKISRAEEQKAVTVNLCAAKGSE